MKKSLKLYILQLLALLGIWLMLGHIGLKGFSWEWFAFLVLIIAYGYLCRAEAKESVYEGIHL